MERNKSICGIPGVKKGVLRFHTSRPAQYGLEMHLLTIQGLVNEFKPDVLIVDPISNLVAAGSASEVRSMLMRLIDGLKMAHVVTLCTNLMHDGDSLEHTQEQISSLMDTWLLVRDIELGGERNRALYVLKSRGMVHSNQIREFLLTDHGIELQDAYAGPGGVLTGAARAAQEAQEIVDALAHEREAERKRWELERRRLTLEAQMTALRGEIEGVFKEMQTVTAEEKDRKQVVVEDRAKMAHLRQADQEV